MSKNESHIEDPSSYWDEQEGSRLYKVLEQAVSPSAYGLVASYLDDNDEPMLRFYREDGTSIVLPLLDYSIIGMSSALHSKLAIEELNRRLTQSGKGDRP